MTRVKAVLKKFGLSENEIQVYLEILRQKDTTHYHISKRTGVPRTTVYDVVLSLQEKDLVRVENSNNQNRIISNAPGRLNEIIKERFNDLQTLESDISSIIPKLTQKSKLPEGESATTFWEGIEGSRKAYFAEDFEEVILPRYIISDLNSLNTFGEEDSANKYPYEIKELIPINEWSKYILKKRFKNYPDSVKQREYRFIEHPLVIQYTRTTIIGDKILHSCAFQNEAWGLLIESKAYSASMKSFFDYLWSKSKKLSCEVIKKWPEITMPDGTLDTPSVVIEGGKVQRV